MRGGEERTEGNKQMPNTLTSTNTQVRPGIPGWEEMRLPKIMLGIPRIKLWLWPFALTVLSGPVCEMRVCGVG